MNNDCDRNLENKSAYNAISDYFALQFQKEHGKDEYYEEQDAPSHTSFEDTTELNYSEGSYEYFQQLILGYQSKLHNLLGGVDLTAASNLYHKPGARNKVIKELDVLLYKLNNNKEKIIKVPHKSFETLKLLQEASLLKSPNIESINDIDKQTSQVSKLRNILVSSLKFYPDHAPDNTCEGFLGLPSDNSEYYNS